LNGNSQEQKTWTFEYRLPVRRRSMLPPFPSEPVPEAVGRPARLARLLALGHQLESTIASGEVPDYGALARQVQVSPARIGQITLLTKLAPQIQEYLLFLSAEHSGLITEPQLREIARELSWARQQEVFCELVGRHGQPKEGVN